MSDTIHTQAPTEVSEWKKSTQAQILVLPSGKKMKIRRPGMDSFIRNGTIPNSLLGVVTEALDQGKDQKELQAELGSLDIASDPTKLNDIMQLTDDVICQVAVSPRVHPVAMRDQIEADPSLDEAEKAEKLDSTLFIDEVGTEDKFFIFRYVVGGSSDLTSFREELTASVAVVPAVGAAPHKAKRARKS